MASYIKDCSRSMDCSITSQKGLFCGMSESSMPKSEEMKCMCTSFQGAFDMGMSMMNFPCMGKKVSSFGEQACSHNPYFIDHLF